jgi:tetratricopeptide (TPR) repeat protein
MKPVAGLLAALAGARRGLDFRQFKTKEQTMNTKNIAVLGALTLAVLLAGCGGKEERLASHMQKGKNYFAEGNLDKARIELKNVLQIDPKHGEAYFVSGQIEEQQRNVQKAYANYQKAVDLDPANVAAIARLGNIYLFAGDLAQAEKSADSALGKKPDDPAGLTLRAAVLARKKDFGGAVDMARRVIKLDPGYSDAYGLLAGIYSNQGKSADAIGVLEQGVKANPSKGDLRLALVAMALSQNAPEKAVQQYRELIALEPKNRDYRVGLARVYAANKDMANAEATLRESIQADPGDVQRTILLADLLASTARQDQAVKELTAAVEAKPEAYPLRFSLAGLHQAMGKPGLAEPVLDAIVKRDKLGPDGLRARTQLAALLLARERFDEAEKLLAEVLKENPRDNLALVLRSQMEVNAGDLVGAIADLRSVLKDQPNSIDVMTRLARAHLANKEPQMAVEAIGKAVALVPNDAGTRVLLAEVRSAAGDRKGALNELQTVLKADPKFYAALVQKAQIEAGDKDWRTAEKTLTVLVQSYPKDAQAHYRLGMVQYAQRKLDAAAAGFEQALSLQSGAIEPLSALADVYFTQSKPEKAAQRVGKAAADNPKNFFAQTLLGRVLERQNKAQEAEAALRKAVEIEPKVAGVHIELAGFFSRRKDDKSAEAALKDGLAALPGDVGLRLQLAEVYLRRATHDQAIAQYEAILKDHPRNEAATNNLASMLLDTRSDKATAERALQLTRRFKDSPNLAYMDTFGWAQVRADRVDEGLLALRKVIDKAPNVPVFQYHLGVALHRKGDLQGAKPLLQKAAEAKTDFPGKEEAKQLLARS